MALSRLNSRVLQRAAIRVPWSRAKSGAVTLPGRLGDPSMSMATDPRTHPAQIKAFEPFDLHKAQLDPPPVSVDASVEDKLQFFGAMEAGFETVFNAIVGTFPAIEGVESHTEVIKGVDGNDINLYITKPQGTTDTLPCMYHTHGGGMSLMAAQDPYYVYWRNAVASTGMVVVGVEFRNACGKLGPHPFPAGLNDCYSGLQWTHANKSALGYSKLVISGESGGGNLSIATTLKAKLEGTLSHIDGVYAQCPYIYGNYGAPSPSLPSLTENDGYFLGTPMCAVLATLYDIPRAGQDVQNPLAWPYHATEADVAGMPPVTITVNELDPLRDEGLAFFRTLVKAGVPATARTIAGTAHAGDCSLFGAAPEVSWSSVRDIKSFADSL